MEQRLSQFKWQGHFPYPAPRQIQIETLNLLEANWNKYDVFVIKAPTAYGKSALAKTLMNALRSVSYITPTNLLVDQFRAEFPDTATLSRLDSYWCKEWLRPCSATKGKKGAFCNKKNSKCGKCPASADLSTALYRRGPGAYNYHIYTAHQLYRDVLVVDEAHNLIPHIRDRMALRIWRHDYPYPLTAWKKEQFLEWFESLPASKQAHKKMQILHAALTSSRPEYVVSRAIREFNGKGTVRGEPEERECIELLPVDISNAPRMFNPSSVKKVILLSATINHIDVEQLGFRGRICYLECKSPIPADSRPIVVDPVVTVNYRNVVESTEKLASKITELATKHAEEKGVVHATYQIAGLLRKYLAGNSRFLFHDRTNKKEVYEKFRKSDKPLILVACGMYEGIDLPGDLGRWQVITKIPWPSLGDESVKYHSENNPEYYVWQTLKTVIQACGRVCRTPEDYGITTVLDGSFQRLYDEGNHLMPEWFKDALWDIDSWNNRNV